MLIVHLFIWILVHTGKAVIRLFLDIPYCTKNLLKIHWMYQNQEPISTNKTTCLSHVIIRDEVFGIIENVMSPYRGKHLTHKKKIFNYRLSRACRYIECTFGIMANRWRIFHRPLNVKIDFDETIIKAFCILHNYVRARDGYRDEDTFYEAALIGLHEGNARRGMSANGMAIQNNLVTKYNTKNCEIKCSSVNRKK